METHGTSLTTIDKITPSQSSRGKKTEINLTAIITGVKLERALQFVHCKPMAGS